MEDKPFFVGFSNPRFRYTHNGYLPALEEAPPEPQPLPALLPEHRLSQKVREMEGILNNTRMKILEHIVLSKKKGKTYKY